MNEEIKEILNNKNVSNDPMEDKLTLFRQQVFAKPKTDERVKR